jgi:deoxyribose-phosphate aldolase
MKKASERMFTIAIGSDHSGFHLKEELKKYLTNKGFSITDLGTTSTESVDYPHYAYKVAQKVSSGECERGIMIDGAGIGSCMAANKVKGIRAAMCYDLSSARNSREHNDSNVLTLGAGLIGPSLAKQILEVWLETECTEKRHLRRAQQILQIESGVLSFTTVPDNKVNNPAEIINQGDEVSNLSSTEMENIIQEITEILKQQGVGLDNAANTCTCCSGECGGLCAEKSSDTVREFINMGAGRISYTEGGTGVPKDIARFIDHTLLRPDATNKDVKKVCNEALKYGFASVCINPSYVQFASKILKNSKVKVCTVVGFPFGTHLPEIKGLEARRAIRDGAREIDMVINIGAIKNRDLDLLFRDIRTVVEACDDGSAICKVIFETALLTDEEKVLACQIAKKAKAEFVKTSTGYASGGATAHDVALMSETVHGSGIEVKASGGIRSYEDAVTMLKAGATRIGASASVKIVQGVSDLTESY